MMRDRFSMRWAVWRGHMCPCFSQHLTFVWPYIHNTPGYIFFYCLLFVFSGVRRHVRRSSLQGGQPRTVHGRVLSLPVRHHVRRRRSRILHLIGRVVPHIDGGCGCGEKRRGRDGVWNVSSVVGWCWLVFDVRVVCSLQNSVVGVKSRRSHTCT